MLRLIRPLHFCCPFPWSWATLSSGFWWCDGLWVPCAGNLQAALGVSRSPFSGIGDISSLPPDQSWADATRSRDKLIPSASISFRVLCAFCSVICLAHVHLRLLWNHPHNSACLNTACWGLAVPCCTQSLSVCLGAGVGISLQQGTLCGRKPEAWNGHGNRTVSCRSRACVGGTTGDRCVLHFNSSSIPTESRKVTACLMRWGCEGCVSGTAGWF